MHLEGKPRESKRKKMLFVKNSTYRTVENKLGETLFEEGDR